MGFTLKMNEQDKKISDRSNLKAFTYDKEKKKGGGNVNEKLLLLWLLFLLLLLFFFGGGPFENIVGKGENAGDHHFLLFPIIFSIQSKKNYTIWSNSDMAKILLSGKGLTQSS